MSKRGENIYRRKDGRWEGRYIKGRKPDGKPQFGYIYGIKYNEVKTKLVPLRYQYRKQTATLTGFLGTLSDWALCWMEELVKSPIKRSTYAYYNGILQKHILPYFGKKKKLVSITQSEIQDFVDSLSRKSLGSGAVRGVFGLLSRLFKQAEEKNALLVSPCRRIRLPRATKPKIHILTTAQQKKLTQAARQEPNGPAVLLALYTGMRIGEICALKWEDIDLEEEVLHVQRTVQRIACITSAGQKTQVVFGRPKSEHSDRKIPLPKCLGALLAGAKSRSKSAYVVSVGNCFAEPRVVRYRYRKLLQKAGIQGVHFHALRHTFATRCMETGIDVTTVSRLLGHSSVKMTLDLYTDSLLEHKREVMHRLNKLFISSAAVAR